MERFFYMISDLLDVAAICESFLGFIYKTEHQEAFEKGIVCMETLDEDPSPQNARKALSYLNQINYEDKLYVQAASCYFRVFCYACIFEFDEARKQISALSNLEIDFITLKKDTIRELQAQAPQLYESVDELQREYERSKREEKNTGEFNWKPLAIALIVVVAVLIGVVVGLAI